MVSSTSKCTSSIYNIVKKGSGSKKAGFVYIDEYV